MLNKFRRYIRKFPGFSFLIFAGLIAIALQYLYSEQAAKLMLQMIAVIALFQVMNSIRHSWRHGFYGIHILPAVAISTALFQNQLWAAYVLAIVVAIEKPLFCLLQRNRQPVAIKASSLTNVQHTELARKLDRLSVPYIILILLLAGSLWIVSGSTDRFLKVLAAASTAPLLLAAPAAYITGIKRAGNKAIAFANATAFEKLARTKTVILYKSGVITKPEVTVDAVQPFNKYTKAEVLKIAASLAASSEHSLSRAIVAYAGGEMKITRAKHTQEKTYEGISGRVRGHSLHIGRLTYLSQKGVEIPSSLKEPAKTAVYVGEDDNLIGIVTFNETIQESASTLVQRLKKIGLTSVQLVSGSSRNALAPIAKKIGITEYSGDIHPGDVIASIQNAKDRLVALVADGQSNSAALTAADVAITPGETLPGVSDIILPDHKPSSITQALTFAKKTYKAARYTALFSMWLVVVLLIIAASGKVAVIYLAISQIVITVLAMFASVFIKIKD